MEKTALAVMMKITKIANKHQKSNGVREVAIS
jgi:hypothetical protein